MINQKYCKKYYLKQLVAVSLLGLHILAGATGILPDTTLLLITEKSNNAQMGVLNTDDEPLLLLTTIVDIPDDKGTTVYPLPAVMRVEAHGRQIVRFVLDETATPLKVQHLKRVLFEGIPAVKVDGKGKISTTVRQDMPVIISPAGLEQDPMPWKKLHFHLAGDQLTLSNPSPYVVRLSQTISLLMTNTSLKILPRTYVLPGESFSVTVPGGITDTTTSLRIFPASPYGFDVDPFDAAIER
ncbi:fimbria/pilus chaperone family protein [Glaciimonas immobilis]|uniref:P pilus assembly chaperone PapD n=1 Tax=Glaciimonas immobilis TaxID=728004 RepID=A0A840RLU3_9BURK|nr:fimbria/pilus chaperone family protein [Glaciimonas immobilis]KAF3999267.1 fimbria/pilus periplasmic chaperone [Glaciimonas immobilis]MBB5198733.1 P pilus assembly chaperone PapD [Glaciimonas immobilis]